VSYRLLADVAPTGPWLSLRLVVDSRPYSLSWNGSRLARGRALVTLCARHPDVAEWLCEYLAATWPTVGRGRQA
jgi:hypothetical protein